ncbi:hypothetical protein GGF41_004577 [Coemansia sp. RSA 2531]|nr:hypothetical protein GGF41_004577 [Coemansia sp. RSA 2531]
MAARGKGHAYNTRSKGRVNKPRDTVPANEHLDAYARDILKWTSKKSSTRLAADNIAPFLESLMLFIAHHIKDHYRRHGAADLFKPEDCRLILPVNNDMEVERTDFDSADYVDLTDFFSVKCGMFPISNGVTRQKAPAPHLIFADAEMVGHPDDYTEAELRLATKTKALFFNQHNRRIRYVVDRSFGSPYLKIDVHNMDKSTGKVEPQTYYSQWCLGAADRLNGCHARYFAASASPESMDKPAFLIKDVWMATGSGSADDAHESSVLAVLHSEFNKSNEFSGSFVWLVSAGPVYISQGNTVVADSTATAFSGLSSTTQDAAKGSDSTQGSSRSKVQHSLNRQVRQHRCTVTKWAGNMISEAENQSQVVVAVADAMIALNAAYDKCKILHGNISNRAILLQQTVDGIRGVLAEFDYACYAGVAAVESPELMLFQSMRSLDNPRVVRTFLDDCESLLYLVCWLGTFGINKAERAAYIAGLPKNPYLPILTWNQGTTADIANAKRLHVATEETFHSFILSKMRNGPLRPLAEAMYMALFLHP